MNRMGNTRFQKRVIEVTKSDKNVKGYGYRTAASFLLIDWALRDFEVRVLGKAKFVSSLALLVFRKSSL